MASAKQRAAGAALKAFWHTHGRAPRKGERIMRKASTGGRPRSSKTVATSKPKKNYARRAASGLARRVHGKTLTYAGIGGAVAPMSTQLLGDYGPSATMLATGVAADNDALQAVGAFGLGARLGAQLAGGAGIPVGQASSNYI